MNKSCLKKTKQKTNQPNKQTKKPKKERKKNPLYRGLETMLITITTCYIVPNTVQKLGKSRDM